MASTFAGLNIAYSGLNAAQIGLSTTTNNMSNIDTTGYSRQVVNQISVGPAAVYSKSTVGNGVAVNSVDSVYSFRLNQKYWQENGVASGWEVKTSYLEQIENVFGTTDSSNISNALDTLNSALEDLATDTDSASARAVVLEAAKSFCATLNNAYSQLTQLRNDMNSDVKTTVDQINSYAKQIADLNKQISVAKASGAATNELEDQRTLLVDKLSGLADITVTEDENSSYKITIEGTTLVNGDSAKQLECYTVTDTASSAYGMYGIRWADSGVSFGSGDTGALNAYLQLRDGASADNQGIPYYLNQLNEFARTFAKAFNEGVTSGSTTYSGHAAGVGLNDTTDIRFFSYDSVSSADFVASGSTLEEAYKNITAGNISVSLDIQNDTDKIATASSTGEDGNNEAISDMIKICTSANISGNATVNDLYNKIVTAAASAGSYAQTEYDRKDTLRTYLNTSRTSVSGVSSDEETVNLTTYTSAYAASAKMVSAWSEIYQTTINMVNTD